MFTQAEDIRLVIPRRALEVVFDECDRYDTDETGGRILGTYEKHGDSLVVTVNGIIEPGPNAARTSTYFKQDGDHQERVFREIEKREPTVEHLGNWHTHHVNGLRHLSGGDIETYRRTVEHRNHNIDVFYALLVTERQPRKTGGDRYFYKNYLLRRGDPKVYEIPPSALSLTHDPLVWPSGVAPQDSLTIPAGAADEILKRNRVYDRDFIDQFYPRLKSYQSRELGVYWRGPITLIDTSTLEVVVLEDASGGVPAYRVNLRECPEHLSQFAEQFGARDFPSCRAALLTVERMCNYALYEGHHGKKRRRKWMF